jgi:cytochrome c5
MISLAGATPVITNNEQRANKPPTMPEHDPHSSAIKTPKQLVVVVVLAFLVPITVIAILSQLFTSGMRHADESEQRVLERIKPVGTVVIAEATAPKGSMTGQQVYAQICKTCHETGLAGAPKMGDKAAWQPRIAQGEQTLGQHAIQGFQGKGGVMPPKGGDASLTDEEVHRAVVYLANQAGANWKEPAPTATETASSAPASGSAAPPTTTAAATTANASPAPPPAAAPTAVASASNVPATPAPGATKTASAGSAAEGKAVYDQTCHVCHATGLAGSPKFGDKAAWAPRIATGMDKLYNAALHGLNAMPPKGGNASLTDAQVKAAVDYMVAAAK